MKIVKKDNKVCIIYQGEGKAYDILRREECVPCTLEEATAAINIYGLGNMTIQTQEYDKEMFGDDWMGDDAMVALHIHDGKVIVQCFQDFLREQHWYLNEGVYLDKMGEIYAN